MLLFMSLIYAENLNAQFVYHNVHCLDVVWLIFDFKLFQNAVASGGLRPIPLRWKRGMKEKGHWGDNNDIKGAAEHEMIF